MLFSFSDLALEWCCENSYSTYFMIVEIIFWWQKLFLYIGSSLPDSTVDVSNVLNLNDGESHSMVTSSQHSSYSESDFLLMASLQLGALKTLGVLLRSSRYIELLLVPRDSCDGKKTSSRPNSGTGQDDLQVGNFSVLCTLYSCMKTAINIASFYQTQCRFGLDGLLLLDTVVFQFFMVDKPTWLTL